MLASFGACAVKGNAPGSRVESPPATSQPPRPESCRDVSPAEDLQSVLDATVDGGALCLARGTYSGPIQVTRAIVLWGPSDAVIRSSGVGNTVSIHADGARL
jgi:hypothetical protein